MGNFEVFRGLISAIVDSDFPGFESPHAIHFETLSLFDIRHVGQFHKLVSCFLKVENFFTSNDFMGCWVEMTSGFFVTPSLLLNSSLTGGISAVISCFFITFAGNESSLLSLAQLTGVLNAKSFDVIVSMSLLLLIMFGDVKSKLCCCNLGAKAGLSISGVPKEIGGALLTIFFSCGFAIGVTLSDGEKMLLAFGWFMILLAKSNLGSAVIGKDAVAAVISGIVLTISGSLLIEKWETLVFSLFILKFAFDTSVVGCWTVVDGMAGMGWTAFFDNGCTSDCFLGNVEKENGLEAWLVEIFSNLFMMSVLFCSGLFLTAWIILAAFEVWCIALTGGAVDSLVFVISFAWFLTSSLSAGLLNTELGIFFESLTGEDIFPSVLSIRFAVWLVTTFRFMFGRGLAFISVLVVLTRLDTGDNFTLFPVEDSR